MPIRTVEIVREYTWSQPDLQRLKEFIHQHLLSFVGETYSFWGSAIQSGQLDVHHRYETLEDFISIDQIPSLENASLSASNYQINKSIHLNLSDQLKQLRARVEVPYDALEEGSLLLDRLETGLGLIKYEEGRPEAPRPALTQLQRSYSEEQFNIPRLLAVLNELYEHFGQPTYFSGSFTCDGTEFNYGRLDQFKEELTPAWDQVSLVNIYTETDQGSFHLWMDFDAEELQIQAKLPSREDLGRLFESLERKLSLTRLKKNQPFLGERRQYFARQTVDLGWLRDTVSSIEKLLSRKHRFSAHFETVSEPGKEISFENRAAWYDEVAKKWLEIRRVFLYLEDRDLRITFELDVLREWLKLNIESPGKNSIENAYTALETGSGLIPITSEPYRSRKSSGVYKIESWRNANFGAAVKKSVAQYVGDRFDLVEAVVELGPDRNGQIEEFNRLEKFIDRVSSPDPFANAYLYVEGPQSSTLAVSAYDNHQKLELRSSLVAKEFPELERVFKTELKGLKKIAAGEEDGKLIQPESKKDEFLQKALLAIIPLIIGFLLSSATWANVFPKTTLQITVPPANEDGVAVLQAASLPVEWVLEKEQWFKTGIDRAGPARVRVLKDGITQVLDLYNQAPGVTLTLEPGIYDIEVISNATNESDKVRVELKAP